MHVVVRAIEVPHTSFQRGVSTKSSISQLSLLLFFNMLVTNIIAGSGIEVVSIVRPLTRYVRRVTARDQHASAKHTSKTRSRLDPFRTAVPFWGQTTQISSSLSPKRGCGSKEVNSTGVFLSFFFSVCSFFILPPCNMFALLFSLLPIDSH